MKRTVIFAIALVAASCIRPAEERAERDAEIGHATVAGLTLDVRGGLAAVRDARAGDVELWQSAPATEVVLQRPSGAPARWTFRLRNAMPDLTATLQRGATRTPLPVAQGAIDTEKSVEVDLPVGESVLALGPADSDSAQPLRFAVMSDVQEAIDEVQDIYDKVNAEPGVRFLLGAGDLTQQGTVSQLERFTTKLRGLRVPYYTTLGNHELGVTPPPFQDMFGRGNFSFEFQRVRFTLLDSASATLDPMVYDWLDGWLSAGRDQTHIVAMHIPPVDPIGVRNGGFSSRAEAAKLLTRLAKGRVDLTLYGHIHSYYDFDNAGIPAHISGGGGAIPERFDDIGRHFLVVDAAAGAGIQGVRIVRVD
ncbi:MAG: metallophosphoesterase [Polyangiaceae bacterium]